VQGLEQHVFSEHEKYEFATKPGALMEYRRNIERGLNGQFGIFLKDSNVNSETEAYFRQQMTEKLHNPFLEEKLIPNWHVGCRRLTHLVSVISRLSARRMSRQCTARSTRSLSVVADVTTDRSTQ
jgi:hypothetical protein